MENVESPPSDPDSLSFRPVPDDVYSEQLARGSAADVWKITQGMPGGHPLARVSKILRVSSGDFAGTMGVKRDSLNNQSSAANDDISWAHFVKKYSDKVAEWASLAHPNIVQVYDFQYGLNLCVEYCPNGSVREYLKAHAEQQINKIDIISDVLAGLDYLHGKDPQIVHGSLNAGKLFVDAHGRTKIGEFGLTALCYDVAPLVPSVVFTGFSRWMSPELFALDGNALPTTASDIWALACTIIEVISERLPYMEYKHDVRIQRAIMKGEPPARREAGFNVQYDPELWSAIESCWARDPCQRPSIRDILTQMESTQRRMSEGDPSGMEKASSRKMETASSSKMEQGNSRGTEKTGNRGSLVSQPERASIPPFRAGVNGYRLNTRGVAVESFDWFGAFETWSQRASTPVDWIVRQEAGHWSTEVRFKMNGHVMSFTGRGSSIKRAKVDAVIQIERANVLRI